MALLNTVNYVKPAVTDLESGDLNGYSGPVDNTKVTQQIADFDNLWSGYNLNPNWSGDVPASSSDASSILRSIRQAQTAPTPAPTTPAPTTPTATQPAALGWGIDPTAATTPAAATPATTTPAVTAPAGEVMTGSATHTFSDAFPRQQSALPPANDFNTSMQNFMSSLQSFMPAPPAPPSLSQQAINANMMAGQAYKVPELTQEQLNRMSSAWQAEQLISADSPLLQLAQARAMQQGNARGLLNSTANMNAGTRAMLEEAGNYGRADAGTYASVLQSDRGADARARDLFASSAFREADLQRQAENEYRNSMLNAAAKHYEGAVDRDFQTGRDATLHGYNLEQLGVKNQFDIGRDATLHGYNLEQLGVKNQFDIGRLGIENAFTTERDATKFGYDKELESMRLANDAAKQAGLLENQLTLADRNLANQLTISAANNAASLEATRQAELLRAKTQLERDELQRKYELEDAEVKRTQLDEDDIQKRQTTLWTNYQTTISKINMDLAADINKIQTSALPENVKAEQIRALQTTAKTAVELQNALFTANRDWVSSWQTLVVKVDPAPTTTPTTEQLVGPISTTPAPAPAPAPAPTDAAKGEVKAEVTATDGRKYTTADAIAHMKNLGLMDDDGNILNDEARMGIYNEAKRLGITAAQFDELLRLPPGTAAAWIASKGLAPL